MASPEQLAYRKACQASQIRLMGHRPKTPKQVLQQLADATDENEKADVYGGGAIIEEFEHEIAELLGKEAAVFMPSGTMAQPIALRIWADQARSPYVALPHTSHLALHEHNSYQVLYGLKGIMLGQAHQVPGLDDLKAAACDPLAAILLELPMREIGGQLPSWKDLIAQSDWAKAQGIKLHLDGARLWQCPAAYDRSLADICALFDSVYVSLYKDLGGIAGAILAGDKAFIDTARIWLRRTGGNLYALYPYVIAAREGLNRHLPLMPQRTEHARWLAEQLNSHPAITTCPQLPQTNMFRLRIQCEPASFLRQATDWVQAHGVALIPPPYRVDETCVHCELTVGENAEALSQAQWQTHLTSFLSSVL